MQDARPNAPTDSDVTAESSRAARKAHAPGALNALLLGTSVAVILGMFGFGIFQASRQRESDVFTPAKPAAESITARSADSEPSGSEELSAANAAPVAEEPPDEAPDTESALVSQEQPAPATAGDAAPALEADAMDEEKYLEHGWKAEASQVLEAFLTSEYTGQRGQWVLEPGRVANILEAIETLESPPWSELSAQDFNHVDLSLNDRRKGMFLMLRKSGGDEDKPTEERSYAFFKRTEDGLKLDLELFLQTTGKSFQTFTAEPRPGTTRVFRVFITEDPGSNPSETDASRGYIIAGLANFDSAIRIPLTRTSPVGRILEAANFRSDDGERQIMRNATVELRWTDQPNDSKLELSRFLCWEFLGLGGKPMDEPVTLQW